jgi:hypothetical protein
MVLLPWRRGRSMCRRSVVPEAAPNVICINRTPRTGVTQSCLRDGFFSPVNCAGGLWKSALHLPHVIALLLRTLHTEDPIYNRQRHSNPGSITLHAGSLVAETPPLC